jgi:hypothetical protein
MELLLIIGAMVFLAVLAQGQAVATEETQPIIIVQARPQSSGCMPAVMFVLGAAAAVVVLSGILAP